MINVSEIETSKVEILLRKFLCGRMVSDVGIYLRSMIRIDIDESIDPISNESKNVQQIGRSSIGIRDAKWKFAMDHKEIFSSDDISEVTESKSLVGRLIGAEVKDIDVSECISFHFSSGITISAPCNNVYDSEMDLIDIRLNSRNSIIFTAECVWLLEDDQETDRGRDAHC